ncbi:MAG TPA: acyl-CoA thioesterase II [Acidimicrobiales bacterium]|nr:acyl-CoA thioesterase II [Acidimicrobiales bacterium]
MEEQIGQLASLLDLERIEDNLFRSSLPHAGEGMVRVFGGQVAAQALIAAGRTVDQGSVHSLHSYFLRPGDLSVPIVFDVDRIRNGRSFTTRRVVAVQHGEAIFNLQCSFHLGEGGPDHATEAPAVPQPEDLPDAAAARPSAGHQQPPSTLQGSVEVRYATEVPWQRGEAARAQRLWLRVKEPLPADPLVHAAAIAFVSDLSLIDATLQPHGLSVSDTGFTGASLDHCMWFHRPARADEWLLYDQHSPSATGGRGLAVGSLFSSTGQLAVTVAQEGLIRFRHPAGR